MTADRRERVERQFGEDRWLFGNRLHDLWLVMKGLLSRYRAVRKGE